MNFLKYSLIGAALVYSLGANAYAGGFWSRTYENLKKAKVQVEKNIKIAKHEFQKGIEDEFLKEDEIISFRSIIDLAKIANSDTNAYNKMMEKLRKH